MLPHRLLLALNGSNSSLVKMFFFSETGKSLGGPRGQRHRSPVFVVWPSLHDLKSAVSENLQRLRAVHRIGRWRRLRRELRLIHSGCGCRTTPDTDLGE